MNVLERVSKKKKKLIVGLMSGTSADGIDAVLVEVRGSGPKTRLKQLAFATYPFPAPLTRLILRNSDSRTARLDDIARLNVFLGVLFAEAAKRIIRQGGKSREEVDLIGSHGQTIQHLPAARRLYGEDIRATLQIGNPSVIAKRAGIATVGDFRLGDVAVGGTGAPLVPFVDHLLLRSQKKNRALLNIGGIANITLLPAGGSLDSVIAFDTGPGNMVIDYLARNLFGKSYDVGGRIASRGMLLPSVLNWMADHAYLRRPPPKSTGRELFGESFAKKLLLRSRGQRREDIVATASEFTALSVYLGARKFFPRAVFPSELLVSGGGSRNNYIMHALRRYFAGATVSTTDATILPARPKEAICFAILANETIAGNPSNVRRVTGAKKATVLGTICPP